MALTLTYLDDLARVRINVTGLTADRVRVQRSSDGGPWEPVRGGVSAAPSAGDLQLDDYEWPDGVQSTYRVLDAADESVLESDSITPSLGGKVWLKHVRYPNLNRPVTVQNWSPRTRTSRDAATPIAGRTLPVSTSDVRLAPEFTLTLITGDLYDPEHDGEAEAAQLDAILAVGGVWYIHVPAGQPIPGGYVIIGATSVGRVVDAGRPPYRVELPCQVVAPPSPLIVGTTLTWETVRRLWGSWTALRSDAATWRALRDVIGDPIDLEVH